MDNTVIKLTRDYIISQLEKDKINQEFEVYIVWKCKTLQNWKYLTASTINDGKYYELTFDGNNKKWYFDEYLKVNQEIYTVGKLC